MIHYHGTPITPRTVLNELGGKNFCVSFAAPHDVQRVHQIGQSVMLDNGAFTFWRQGLTKAVDAVGWDGYYEWAEPWLQYQTTWAVIPDVIDGTEEDNDRFLQRRHTKQWAPVWHMHESLARLYRLCLGYEKVCIGSSGMYAQLNTPQWHRRMEQVFNFLCPNSAPDVWLHMLRGMALSDGPYPFASVDSTDVARNHNRRGDARNMADRWDAKQPPPTWVYREQLAMEAA